MQPGLGADGRARRAAVSAGFAMLFGVAMLAGRLTHPEWSPLSLAWPAAGVALFWYLRLSTTRERLVALALITVISGVINQAHGLDPLGSWLFGLVNATPGWVGAAVLQSAFGWSIGHAIRNLDDVLSLSLAAIAGAVASAVFGGLVAWSRFGSGLWEGTWLIAYRNLTSIIIVTAALAAVPNLPRAARRLRPVDWALVVLMPLTTVGLMFVPWWLPAAAIPLVLPLAIRCGPAITACVVALQGVIVVTATTLDAGPFAEVEPITARVVLAQVFILALALTGLVVATIESARASLYDVEAHRRAEFVARMLPDIERGVRAHEFVTYYQPVVDLETGEAIAHEALVRWNHPVRGVLPPDEFLEVLERSGLIRKVGAVVLRHACTTGASLLAAGRAGTMHVNLCAAELASPRLVDTVDAALEESGLPADLLVLEITERQIVTVDECLVSSLERLRDRGVRVAVDDFGTGFSSLRHLVDLPISMIKLDRSFVAQLASDGNARSISSAVRAMAEGLGLEAVAEGVETDEEALALKDLGYRHGQGYLYGRPTLLA